MLKAGSHYEAVYDNGQLMNPDHVTLEPYTTYASPYLVIDSHQQYCKHYYQGSQRIATQLGNSTEQPITAKTTSDDLNPNLVNNNFDLKALQQLQIDDLNAMLTKNGHTTAKFTDWETPLTPAETVTDTLHGKASQSLVFYFHPDHLGTTTYLTDQNGMPYQFFINLPFGETMLEQHAYTHEFTTPYLFNAKELDPETGNYYYGARYYDPKTSIWLSVDPMAEKYPNFSPYAYTFQNPLNFVDPTGMEGEDWVKGKDGQYYFDSRIKKPIDVQRYGEEGDKYVGETYRDDTSFGNPNATNTYGDSSGNQYNSFTNEFLTHFIDGVEINSNSDDKLSDHLNLSEVTYSETAIKNGINNIPTANDMKNLKAYGENIYDPLYEHFDGNIKISGGYRSLELNSLVGGASPTSQHCLGEALDIQGVGTVSNLQIFNFAKDSLKFNQLIWEYGNKQNPRWVHIGYKPFGKNKNQIFSIPSSLKKF